MSSYHKEVMNLLDGFCARKRMEKVDQEEEEGEAAEKEGKEDHMSSKYGTSHRVAPELLGLLDKASKMLCKSKEKIIKEALVRYFREMRLDDQIEVCPKCNQAVTDGMVWVDDCDFALGVLSQAGERRVCRQCVRG